MTLTVSAIQDTHAAVPHFSPALDAAALFHAVAVPVPGEARNHGSVILDSGIDPSTRGAWFVDWLSRAKAGGLRSLVLPDIVHRRRLHLNNYGRLHAAERNLHHLRALRGSVLRSRSR